LLCYFGGEDLREKALFWGNSKLLTGELEPDDEDGSPKKLQARGNMPLAFCHRFHGSPGVFSSALKSN
jgi:hypothetical protein